MIKVFLLSFALLISLLANQEGAVGLPYKDLLSSDRGSIAVRKDGSIADRYIGLIAAYEDDLSANSNAGLAYEDLLANEGLSGWKALLHYKGEASVIGAGSPFFISPNGHKDYIAELNATIEALKNDPNTQCKYPARTELLLEYKAIEIDDPPFTICEDYQEYLRKVPFDRVYLVFTAEDQSSPASIMGHTVLKIAGEDINGVTREHSFSFMALMSQSGNFKRYINAVLNGSEGAYALSPYSETIKTYIYGERRSLWEFELSLTFEAKERLRKHLWELKETPILYQFITHNCNTAMEAILNAADQGFADSKHWLFATPIEYLGLLEEKDMIKSVSVVPNAIDKAYFAQGKTFYPLNAPSASKIGVQVYKNGARLTAMPNYRDMRSVSNASQVEFENKLIEVIARYEDRKVAIERINLIAMKTIADYRVAGSSKLFRLGIDESVGDRLSPVAEWGRGAGALVGDNTHLYALAAAGFAQGKRANLYAFAEIGAIARVGESAKILANWTRFADTDKNYRGFDSELNAHIVYALAKDYDISLSYARRFGVDRVTAFCDRRSSDRKICDRLTFGVNVYF